jgi:hypothetical protein
VVQAVSLSTGGEACHGGGCKTTKACASSDKTDECFLLRFKADSQAVYTGQIQDKGAKSARESREASKAAVQLVLNIEHKRV